MSRLAFPPRDHLDPVAALPDRLRFAHRVAAALPAPAGAHVAEAPAGVGLLTLELLRLGFRPQPVEPDEQLRARTRDLLRGKRVREGDLDNLPFAAGSMPAVASLYGVCGLPEDRRLLALDEIARVLAPDGVLALGELGDLRPAYAPADGRPALDLVWLVQALAERGFRTRLTQFTDRQWIVTGARSDASHDAPLAPDEA